MTPSDTCEYAWNPQTTVSLTELHPNLCLITEELSLDTVQYDQNQRYYELHPEQFFLIQNSVEITFTLIPMVSCFLDK